MTTWIVKSESGEVAKITKYNNGGDCVIIPVHLTEQDAIDFAKWKNGGIGMFWYPVPLEIPELGTKK